MARILFTTLAAVAVGAIAAPAAQADVYSCVFTGAAEVADYAGGPAPDSETGVESILYDASVEQGSDGVGILDTDNGNGRAEAGGQDGSYMFNTQPPAPGRAECLYVSTVGGGAGVFPAEIDSSGEYDNVICGTGWAVDDDVPASEVTSVMFAGIPDITDIDYRIDFTSGLGFLDIRSAMTASGKSGSGQFLDGVVSIAPTEGDCVTSHVSFFQVSGTFTIATF